MALAGGTYMLRWSHAPSGRAAHGRADGIRPVVGTTTYARPARSPPTGVDGLRGRRGSAVPVRGPARRCRPGSATGMQSRSGVLAVARAGGTFGRGVEPLGEAAQQQRGPDVRRMRPACLGTWCAWWAAATRSTMRSRAIASWGVRCRPRSASCEAHLRPLDPDVTAAGVHDETRLRLGVTGTRRLLEVDVDVARDGVEVEVGRDPVGDGDGDVAGAVLARTSPPCTPSRVHVARARRQLEVAGRGADLEVAGARLGLDGGVGAAQGDVTAARDEVERPPPAPTLMSPEPVLASQVAARRLEGDVTGAGLEPGRADLVEGEVAGPGARPGPRRAAPRP